MIAFGIIIYLKFEKKMHSQTSTTNKHESTKQSHELTSASTGARIVPNNCRNDFEYFLRQYCWHQ